VAKVTDEITILIVQGVVAKMRKIWGKRALLFLVALCLLFTVLCQNAAFVSAKPEEKTFVINFEESMNEKASKTVEIPNLFEISDVTVDTGKVSYKREGDKVTVSVSEGVYEEKSHTKEVTITIKDPASNDFPEIHNYDVDGYKGILKKVDSGYDTEKEWSWVKYEGSVTKEKCKYYKYKVEIKYTENVRPEVYLSEPKRGMITNYKIDVKGYVKDENVGDELKLYFSFDSYNDSMDGNLFKDSIIADGTNQSISGTIDLTPFNLKDGKHSFYFWAVDKMGVRSNPDKIEFTVDTVPPEKPVLVPDKTEITNESVVVSVYYPQDAVKKEIKINDGSWQSITDISKNDQVVMDDNGKIEARATDEAGNVSEVAELVISNIDKTPPETPIILQKPDNNIPTKESVLIEIIYPDDAVTRLYKVGKDDKWSGYEDKFYLSVNEAVYAVCMDLAGNLSKEAVKVVTNIDTYPPTAPTINTSAQETQGQSITATIVPGVDNESGVNRTEYCLKGATTKDWEKYEDGTVITITALGETEICARTIDNAGNISPETSKKVVIKEKKDNSGGNNGGGNNGGGNNGGGNNGGGNNGGGNNGGGNNGGKNNNEITEPNPNIPAVYPMDLSVFIHADKSQYEEGEVITFTVTYKNKTNIQANNVVVKAEIPEDTTAVDVAGGTQKENSIEWKIESLKANSSGKIQYKVKVNLLDVPEISSSATAYVTADGTLINKDDDESKTIFLLYSNRFGENFHGKYIAGYEDNTFRPLNNITRAEVATIMANILGLKQEISGSRTYPDVSKNHWAYNNIIAVTEKGLFTGYEDGTFRPDNFITRAEFATVLAKYLKLKNVEHEESNFADIENHWAQNYIEEIYRVRLIEGYLENGVRLFKPDNYITRSEAVTIINKMLFRGPLEGAKVPFTDVEEGYWAYGHILESSIDHYYVRNKDQKETIVNKQ